MSDNIIQMEDQRPHATFVDPVSNNAHVVPISLVRQWSEETNQDIDPEIVRAIIHDWLIDNSGEEVWVSQNEAVNNEDLYNKYYELLHAVEQKVDGRSRHEQALHILTSYATTSDSGDGA